MDVYCDNAWADAIKLAVGPLTELKSFVKVTNMAHLDSGRPTRRKQGNPHMFAYC